MKRQPCPDCGVPLHCYKGESYCPDCTRFTVAPTPPPAATQLPAMRPAAAPKTGRTKWTQTPA